MCVQGVVCLIPFLVIIHIGCRWPLLVNEALASFQLPVEGALGVRPSRGWAAGGALRPGAPRDLLLTTPLSPTGLLCFCAVGRQQPGVLHDAGQDLPPELVEPWPDRCHLQTPGLGSSAGAPRAQQQDRAQTPRLSSSFLLSLPVCSRSFLNFFSLKNKSGCNAAGAVQTLPSGAIVFGVEHQTGKQTPFLRPESLGVTAGLRAAAPGRRGSQWGLSEQLQKREQIC